ncbi:MAG: hypothetical protein ACK5Z5_02835 [Neisseriaceae bacterium]|jgi:hypothetical protein
MNNHKYNIKKLQWIVEENNTMYAQLDGLPWTYYITQINDKFEVVTICKNINYIGNYGLFVICDSLSEAQLEANNHYAKAISNIMNENIISISLLLDNKLDSNY